MSTRVISKNGSRFNWRLFFALLGLIILGNVLLIPYVDTLTQATSPEIQTPLLKALQVIQRSLLFGLLAAVGLKLASRVGLGLPVLEALLEKRPITGIRKIFIPAIVLGAAAGTAIVALDVFIFASKINALQQESGIIIPVTAQPTPIEGFMASFYGGIVEEVLLRLFFMTLLVWLVAKVFRIESGLPPKAILWSANLIAALIFSLGHVSVLTTIGLPINVLTITRIICLNMPPALIFGWLYWTRGLESAMVSHFTADIVVHVVTVYIVSQGLI